MTAPHSPSPQPAPAPQRAAIRHWLALLFSGMAEAIWAGVLAAGVLHLGRAALFALGLTLSLTGLAYAMRAIPMGTAYAIWTGIGAATTAGWSAVLGEEFGPAKIACLALIVAGVAGLQLTSGADTAAEAGPTSGAEGQQP